MGKLTDQVKSEFKQLPFLLGKLLGGILAVLGFTVAIVTITRKPAQTLADILPSSIMGIFGIGLFVLSSTLLAKHQSGNDIINVYSKDLTRTSILSWAILLLLAALFLFFVYLCG